MKIFSPIDNVNEVHKLIDAGVNELYCGAIPEGWRKTYSRLFSINRRNYKIHQVNTFEDLITIISVAHSKNVKVYVTLNSLFYIESQKDMLLDFLKMIEELEVDGVIISSLAVINLCKKHTDLNISVSGESLCINTESVKFYNNLGVDRIIFPRDITLGEMNNIVKSFPNLEFEAFLMRERCSFCGGNCFASHGIEPEHFCSMLNRVDLFNLNKDILSYDEYEKFEETVKVNDMWRKRYFVPSMNKGKFDIRNSVCGLCSLKKLKELNISSLKIVGRGIPTETKLKYVRLVKEAIELSNSMENHNEFLHKIKQIKGANKYCDDKLMCYYRDI